MRAFFCLLIIVVLIRPHREQARSHSCVSLTTVNCGSELARDGASTINTTYRLETR